MSDISLIGTGSMGTALGKTLLVSGHKLTVWNRSLEKAIQLESDGAIVVSSVKQAIEASPLILVCINDYATSNDLFAPEDISSCLSHRSFVQFSTGTPQNAHESEKWFQQKNADYMDAAILGAPRIIGTEAGKILLAGKQASWNKHRADLGCLAGNLLYTGDNIGSAAVLDLAWLSQAFGMFMGALQGLMLCEAGGVSPETFGSTVAATGRITLMSNTVQNKTFHEVENSVNIWDYALRHISEQARETGINTEILDFIRDKFERAQSAGYGEEDLAALIKIFQK